MNATVETLRPSAVDAHVRRIARRIGCNAEGVTAATQAAARALRAGDTAHRAILAGVHVAASNAEILRRIRECAPIPTARDHFWRDLALDSLGLLGMIFICTALVLAMWAVLGATP